MRMLRPRCGWRLPPGVLHLPALAFFRLLISPFAQPLAAHPAPSARPTLLFNYDRYSEADAWLLWLKPARTQSDALAREGVRFERAFSRFRYSSAHASILTGFSHLSMWRDNSGLSVPEHTTLAEIFNRPLSNGGFRGARSRFKIRPGPGFDYYPTTSSVALRTFRRIHPAHRDSVPRKHGMAESRKRKGHFLFAHL